VSELPLDHSEEVHDLCAKAGLERLDPVQHCAWGLRQIAWDQLVELTRWSLSHAAVGLEIADVDGCGRQDIVAASDDGFEVLRQDPSGGLLAAKFHDALLSLGFSPQGLAVGDINSDGTVDLVGGGLRAVLGRATVRGTVVLVPPCWRALRLSIPPDASTSGLR
jgi:hypothetical protein